MRRIGCLLAASTMTLAAAACSSSTPPTLHAGTYTASGEQTPLDQIHLFKYANGQLVGTVVLGAPTDSAHANLAFIIDKPNDVPMHARFATGTATIDHITTTGFTLENCTQWMPRANGCRFTKVAVGRAMSSGGGNRRTCGSQKHDGASTRHATEVQSDPTPLRCLVHSRWLRVSYAFAACLALAACSSRSAKPVQASLIPSPGTYGATAESAPRDQIVLVKLGSGQLEGTLALRSVTGGAETNLSFVVDPAVRPLRATFASGTGNIVEVTARGFTLIGCERWMPRVQTGQANSCQFSRAG